MRSTCGTKAYGALGFVILGLLALQMTGLAQHSFHDITFNPTSPAELEFGAPVNYKLNYRTNEPGGVRIIGWPLTGGSYSGDMWHSGSPVYPSGGGSASGYFTINAGEKTVEQVRFVMLNTANAVVHVATVDVRYKFTGAVPGPAHEGECVCEHKVQTNYGSFNVCVGVEHHAEPNWDCYTYIITNIDYCREGCGVCVSFVSNAHGHTTANQWGPPGWLMNWPDGDEWQWHAPPGSCGIMPGETAKMGFCVPAPTELDREQEAAVWGCTWGTAVTGAVTAARTCPWKFLTCGPGRKLQEGTVAALLPDLVIESISHTPLNPAIGQNVTFTVVTRNQGIAGAAAFNVQLQGAGPAGIAGVSSLAAGASITHTFNLPLSTSPETFTATADPGNQVTESDETNNERTHVVRGVAACTYSIDPTSWTAPECGGSTRVQLTTQAGCPWRARTNDPWLTVVPTSGVGSSVLAITAASNDTGQTRYGSVVFTGTGWTATLNVAQRPCVTRACAFAIRPTSAHFTARGGTVTIRVTTDPHCRWTATSPCSWVTVSPSSGAGSGTVTVTVAPLSPVARTRSCTLTIAGQPFSITQGP